MCDYRRLNRHYLEVFLPVVWQDCLAEAGFAPAPFDTPPSLFEFNMWCADRGLHGVIDVLAAVPSAPDSLLVSLTQDAAILKAAQEFCRDTCIQEIIERESEAFIGELVPAAASCLAGTPSVYSIACTPDGGVQGVKVEVYKPEDADMRDGFLSRSDLRGNITHTILLESFLEWRRGSARYFPITSADCVDLRACVDKFVEEEICPALPDPIGALAEKYTDFPEPWIHVPEANNRVIEVY